MATVLIGKTCSGKTMVREKLLNYGFNKIVTYTTRPIRPGEIDGDTYHFITDDEFESAINSGFFAEWKSYNTQFGVWKYGTSLSDIEAADENTIIILTPDGYRDLCSNLSKKPLSIYIYANNSTIKKRLKARKDNRDEAKRRLEHDDVDFKGIENEVDKIIYNNLNDNINDVVSKIIEFIDKNKGVS